MATGSIWRTSAWATGHDPRFEEALLLVMPDRVPMLFAGNEGFPYAEAALGHVSNGGCGRP